MSEDIERIDASQAEEIPPTPIAPNAPEPNFAESEGAGYKSVNYENASSGDDSTGKILAIVSLVCGILSLICCCSMCCNIPFSVIAVVCGIISCRMSDEYKAMAIVGIVLGGVAIGLGVVTAILESTFNLFTDVVDNVTNGMNIDEFF